MVTDRRSEARIVIIDDEEANVVLLERILERTGYTNRGVTTDSRQALALCVAFGADIVLLDLHMPPPDGFAVLAELRRTTPSDVYLPTLVLTADVSAEAKQRALSMGAHDFLVKPFDAVEVVLR